MAPLVGGAFIGCVVACGSDADQSSPSATGNTSAQGGAEMGGGGTSGGTASMAGGNAGTASNGGADGLPPENCYPRCLWDLISSCRPISRCISEKTNDLTTECDPDSQWTWSKAATSSTVTVTRRDGSLCYTIELGASVVYYDSNGQPVVTMVPVAGQPYANTVQCTGSSTQIATDQSDPACAPWVAPVCTPGTCP